MRNKLQGEIAQFPSNPDNIANLTAGKLKYCGVKTYSFDKPWLSVVTPSDPVTQNYTMMVTTDDYSIVTDLSGEKNYTVTMTIGYADPRFTNTFTEQVNVTLYHPCKGTEITTSQTVPNLYFELGFEGPMTE
jgi:hypothetical protein